jgi:predicted nucleic acid-binding protein
LIIVDTGPLVAAADADDHDHDRCVAMFRTARRPWLVPQLVIAEVCYLLERERGTVATLNRRDFTVVRPRHVKALTLIPE